MNDPLYNFDAPTHKSSLHAEVDDVWFFRQNYSPQESDLKENIKINGENSLLSFFKTGDNRKVESLSDVENERKSFDSLMRAFKSLKTPKKHITIEAEKIKLSSRATINKTDQGTALTPNSNSQNMSVSSDNSRAEITSKNLVKSGSSIRNLKKTGISAQALSTERAIFKAKAVDKKILTNPTGDIGVPRIHPKITVPKPFNFHTTVYKKRSPREQVTQPKEARLENTKKLLAKKKLSVTASRAPNSLTSRITFKVKTTADSKAPQLATKSQQKDPLYLKRSPLSHFVVSQSKNLYQLTVPVTPQLRTAARVRQSKQPNAEFTSEHSPVRLVAIKKLLKIRSIKLKKSSIPLTVPVAPSFTYKPRICKKKP
ncbi:uncharacterized protein LOC135128529 isoform X2 [Zophobas morio]|uniref:uncharacterized protein LOC135128529 isoform X2 n=1 Tax=Zophobas morio TaxID=2755281 RepID=UPI00308294D8